LANPPAGQARRFTGRDLEVLKHVKSLRAQGLTVARINNFLGKVQTVTPMWGWGRFYNFVTRCY